MATFASWVAVLKLSVVAVILIVATWVVYPAVMWLLARRPRPHMPLRGDLPHVSVVVATRDTPNAVAARIENLLASDYPSDLLSVVVGLDLSNGSYAASSYEFPDARVRFVDARDASGKAAALNRAVSVCRSDVLVFTDTAQRFEPLAIGRLVDALADPSVGIVSGALHNGTSGSGWRLVDIYWRVERALRRNEAEVRSAVGVTGAIFAMRRQLWTDLPEGLILDDLFVPMLVLLHGSRVAFREDAVARETRSFRPEDEYRRKVRTLTGVLQLCVWLPRVLLPWGNPIWAQFVFHKLLRFATPFLGLLILIELIRAGLSYSQQGLTPTLAALLLAVIAVAVVVLATRRGREFAKEALLMQLALVEALLNALRGRWNVWTA